MKHELNAQQIADLIEECITHTFLEPTAHGLLVCIQEAFSGYSHYLSILELNGEQMRPQQRLHKGYCYLIYEALECSIARAYDAEQNAVPRDYPCPVCKDEKPSDPPDLDSATPVDWGE